MRPVPTILIALGGCGLVPEATRVPPPALAGQDVHVTLLHISDIHSRLFPYDFDPSFTDNNLGFTPDDPDTPCADDGDALCGLDDDRGPYGGIARIATLLRRERARADRVLVLDSGDMFQGAVVFNQYGGRAEMLAMTEAGVDASVVGNHEFDRGAHNLAEQYVAWGGFRLLAANYVFDDPSLPWSNDLADLVEPSALFEQDGFRIGVIGLGNLSSLVSITDESNTMDVVPLDAGEVVAREAERLRTQGADLVVVLSHLGLDGDIALARDVDAPDIILGGHHHLAIQPPLIVTHRGTGKRIPVVHSGAFAKFVGRVDLVVRDSSLLSIDYTLFPVLTVPEDDPRFVGDDPAVSEVLEAFQEGLDREINLDQVIGYAERPLRRYGTSGGDSMLGNFTADAMRETQGVETEIALTNTLGIRADIDAGDITIDAVFNAMPFDNTITTMFLSGREVQELLDYVAWRSSERGCKAQAQVSGIRFTMDCDAREALDVVVNGSPLDPDATYELATNDYIAWGGSGFEVLERNTTKVDTGISIRDVVISAIQAHRTLPQPGSAEEEGRIEAVY
ncbi:MAG: bifunctional metallophosphatase/5'-nucleotidase [Deltaproteobacteria bacterium]|nr:bifunctional metallophosphatase/5'-nucleotidase [Deltaproteobacteria bacterium]